MIHDPPAVPLPHDSNNFCTSDLALAAFLVLSRNLVNVEPIGRRVTFVFARDALIQSEINDFMSLRGAVAPGRYSQALRALKSVVHEVQRKGVAETPELAATAPQDDTKATRTTPTVIRRRRTT